MTRLKTGDIRQIPSCLSAYERKLIAITGRSLLGIASYACGVDETEVMHQRKNFSIHVIPGTAGQGIITNFSETVCAILNFLGFNAQVSDQSDTSGLASAYERKANAIMMADDNRFVGINLKTRRVVDNVEMTGRVFAAVLDLMTGGVRDCPVLVMGCGPVGESAAEKLLHLGACVVLYDNHLNTAMRLKQRLSGHFKSLLIQVEEEPISGFSRYPYILDATPSENTIPDALISDHMFVAAPGVPLGVSKNGCKLLENRLIHDKLELGVAAMAAALVSQ